MSEVPTMAFDVEGLRAAATGQDHSAEQARTLAGQVDSIVIVGTDVGGVPAVAGFVAAAQEARNAQAAGVRAESERRTDLGVRFRGTADLGERLQLDTEAMARAATPGGGGDPVPFGDGAEILRQQPPR